MTSPAFKVGDRVTWTSQAAGSWKEKSGDVVYVIPRGAYLDGVVDHDICLAAGLPTLGRRKHISYVVRVGSKLYWPRVAGLRHAGSGPLALETVGVSRAQESGLSRWFGLDLDTVIADALILSDEVDRLRALLADRDPQTCAACKSALVAMCPECSLIPAESRAP